MDIQVLGAAQLTTLAKNARAAGKDVEKDLVDGLVRAVKPLHPAILRNIGPTMPKGYEPVLSASLRVRVARRSSGVIVTVDAKARKGSRALPAIDKGVLKHPVYGRMRRTRRGWRPNPWVSQRVKPGVVTEPFNKLEPKILDEIGNVIEGIARKVAG